MDDVSEDGYYYKEIYLNAPDNAFIDAMFTANDIQSVRGFLWKCFVMI